jgi:hypothetical protein
VATEVFLVLDQLQILNRVVSSVVVDVMYVVAYRNEPVVVLPNGAV